ncbi:MAG: DNA-binding response regulator [Thiomonas sp. 20-64-5]|nr:MAG: DNA-binding response regulator [Thiomonas sp. 20-64-5]
MPPEIRVLLVDDHPLFRRGLVALLAEEPGMQVVGEAADTGEALRQIERGQPDVVLLDNHLPGVRGVDAVAGLHSAYPQIKILMLTVSDDAADLATALRAGASGYLLKTCDIGEIVAAIRRAQHGQVIIGADMAPKLMQAMSDTAAESPAPAAAATAVPPDDDTELLSPRERQIAAAIARGASNKVIARDLDIAETTVKVHVQSILRKLNLSSRVQIAVYASEKGWST